MNMNSPARLFAACAIVVVFSVVASAQQKPCATASKFGPDDQVGNLNYVTPAKTLAASKLVNARQGLSTGDRNKQGHACIRDAHVRDHGAAAWPGGRGRDRSNQIDL